MINRLIQLDGRVSLKKKLIIGFAIIASVPVVLTTLFTYHLSNSALVTASYGSNRTIAVNLAKEMDEMLVSKTKLMKALTGSSSIQSMDPVQQLPMMMSVIREFKEMSVIIVTDSQGKEIVRTSGTLSNVADREYFKEVKNGANYAISDVLIARGTGKPAVMICVSIKDDENRFKGTLLGVIDLGVISQNINASKIGETGNVFLVDRNGKVLAHPEKTLVQQMADLTTIEPVREVIKGNTGVTPYDYQGVKKLAGYSTVSISGWGVIAQQNYDEALAGVSKVGIIGFLLTIFAVLVSIVVGLFAAEALIGPLRVLVSTTAKISEGDLTSKANISTKHELGQLAMSFNAMVDNLQEVIKRVVSTADQVAITSKELSATSNDVERASSQIANTVADFAMGSNNQTEEIQKSMRIVENLMEVSQSVAEKTQLASDLTSEMTKAAETGSDAINKAVNKMDDIKEVTMATAEVVTTLGEKGNQIGQIIDVISGIASQTNLLALNAAIEAARAGEQGRGFAVVAEEVRKLAEQSQVATEKIAQIVQEIQDHSDKAIHAIKNGSSKVNEGVDVVQTAGEALQNILAMIVKCVSMISEINEASCEQLAGIRDMASSFGHVLVIARESGAGAQTVAAASEQVSGSMAGIACESATLAKMVSELQSMVAKFKI